MRCLAIVIRFGVRGVNIIGGITLENSRINLLAYALLGNIRAEVEQTCKKLVNDNGKGRIVYVNDGNTEYIMYDKIIISGYCKRIPEKEVGRTL